MTVPKPEFDGFGVHVGDDWSCGLFEVVEGLPADVLVHVPETLLVWEGDGVSAGIYSVLEPGVSHCGLAWAIERWRATARLRGSSVA